MPGRVVCFEKRREYFLALQSCCARKPCPNFPVWALARLRKFTRLYEPLPCGSPRWGQPVGCSNLFPTNLSVRLAPVGSTPASLPARLSNQTTRPFNQSFTCLDDVVLPFQAGLSGVTVSPGGSESGVQFLTIQVCGYCTSTPALFCCIQCLVCLLQPDVRRQGRCR